MQGERRLEAKRFDGAVGVLDAAYQLMNSLASSEGVEHAEAAVSAVQSRVRHCRCFKGLTSAALHAVSAPTLRSLPMKPLLQVCCCRR